MSSLDRAIDRFCYKHSRFGIPNLMKYIIAGNVIVYLLSAMNTTGTFTSWLTFVPYAILQGQIWRLVTFIFVPVGNQNIFFFAISMYFYYIIGNALEREWGSAKFTLYYIGGMVITAVAALVVGLAFGYGAYSLASAYYINLSLFFAFATLYPDFTVLLFFILPIKMKWLGWLSAALFLWEVITLSFPLNLLPLLALLNYFVFFHSTIIGTAQRLRSRYSKRTINFQKATKAQQQQKGYHHKCAVCGKTDTDYPDMEFRYCSKCNGYYCYCEDHINSHVHIK
ncbi:rhomboid family intramembrane serine protease [Papillibacter cinnamivorans]|uniref:Rhomboid family protein n=1 Tax=Papillibacter cinnamivorans DSM 12816 TaxID=1122930 RepID=A0A1W2BV95_9FIRM|nr:rhomboid family intramembrane serine protease [Papillibacter cinnamivorans]SMC76915.1 Rhomboid family protein [Papillibacter cinnamivorans DSM 12816]